MRFKDQAAGREGRIASINNLYLADEESLIRTLTDAADPGGSARALEEQRVVMAGADRPG